MGNQHSDRNEDRAYDVIKWFPILNIAYGFTRAAVYAGKGDGRRAGLSATGSLFATPIGQALGGPIGTFAGAAVGSAVAEVATIPIKNLPERKY